MGINPAELREWDEYDITRLMIFVRAQEEARATVALRNKVPYYKVPPFKY